MKVLFSLFTQTVKGGIFFLLPLVIVIVLLKKAVELILPLSHLIREHLPFHLPLSAMTLSVVLLTMICFGAGWVARLGVSQKLILLLEENFLVLFPGYQLMKNSLESKVGLDSEKEYPVVLVPIDGWMIAFLVEELNEKEVMVFVPSAPSSWEGSLVIFEKSQIKASNLSPSDLMSIMKTLGVGSKAAFKGKIEKPSRNS
ncbi:hypothetical protein [Algoriphagus terrigena]|uniref:hypothetical protein n=1 Tax=Algoriphagus terrigena TaxID=344884 RepID=UPI0004160FC1|nr:hypothetical protein [Algoriphagus terrigena]